MQYYYAEQTKVCSPMFRRPDFSPAYYCLTCIEQTKVCSPKFILDWIPICAGMTHAEKGRSILRKLCKMRMLVKKCFAPTRSSHLATRL